MARAFVVNGGTLGIGTLDRVANGTNAAQSLLPDAIRITGGTVRSEAAGSLR